MRSKLLAIGGLMLALAGCGGAAVKPLPLSQQATLTVEWEYDTGGMAPFLVPATYADNSRLCTLSQSGQVFFIDAATGDLVYAPGQMPNESYDYYTAGTACSGSIIAGVTGDGWLHVYDLFDGLLWQKNLNTRVFGAPRIADGKLFVVGLDGRLLAFSLKLDRELWRYVSPLENRVRTPLDSAPQVAGDTLYVGLDNGALVALNPLDGRVRWKNIITRPTGSNAILDILDVTTPLVGGDIVCASAHLTGIACFDRDNGQRLWYRALSVYTRVALASDGSRVFAADRDGVLYGFSAAGNELWRNETGRVLTAPPLALADMVLAGAEDGKVYLFDGASGAAVTELQAGASEIIHMLPLTADAALALTLGGQLFRLKLNR